MKVLVTFAVEAELAGWHRLREFRRVRLAGFPAYEARMGAAELRVVLTGMGLGRAARVARAALSDPPNLCISAGFVGGLKPEQRVSHILVAEATRTAARGALASAPNLVQFAVNCGATPVGMFWTSEVLVGTAREKLELAAVADGVEMEGYAVLAEAAERGVPAVAIRAVCDTLEMDLPRGIEGALDECGRVRPLRLLAQLAKRPQDLSALMRLARHSRQAATSLAHFLDEYVEMCQASAAEFELACEIAAT